MPWWLYAILGAIFSGLVSILVKPGIGLGESAISSNLATGIRMWVVLPLAWIVVVVESSFGPGKSIGQQLGRITAMQWTFLLSSGVATGLAWLFYFLALSKADVNQVNPIDKSSFALSFILAVFFLREEVTWQKVTAAILVLAALGVTLIPSAQK